MIKKNERVKERESRKKFNIWLENKTERIRSLSKHYASRASRFGAPAGVALIIFILLTSFLPRNTFQQAKNKLLRNPNDFQAHIALAEKFLENNQFEEAEKALLVAEQINQSANQPINQLTNNVLGEQASSKLEELWQRKLYSDPEDIKKLIAAWGKILEEKPNYRDGYLQLAYLHYKLYENEKAKEYLEEAIELDPNYELARELKKILED